ncbi:MAG: DNA-directed RNA polymerase subunit alpha C-terminal domain-containing protein [Clostridiaceae bacterium]
MGILLKDIKISAPAKRALESVGVKELKDVTKHSEKELLDLHGFGPKGMTILKKLLEENGYQLKK